MAREKRKLHSEKSSKSMWPWLLAGVLVLVLLIVGIKLGGMFLDKVKAPHSLGINQISKAKIGTPIWEFETGGRVHSSPAIGSDGTVYVGSYDNKLYAIRTDSKGLAKSPWPMRGQNAQHTGRVMKK